MAYQGKYLTALPDWEPKKEKIKEPPKEKRTTGWEVEEKPPAQWFNWLQGGFFNSIKELDDALDDCENKLRTTLWSSRTSYEAALKSCTDPSIASRSSASLEFPANSLNYVLLQQAERINSRAEEILENRERIDFNSQNLIQAFRSIRENTSSIEDSNYNIARVEKESQEKISSNQSAITVNQRELLKATTNIENHNSEINSNKQRIKETIWSSESNYHLALQPCNDGALGAEEASQVDFPANPINYTLVKLAERVARLEES